MSTSTEIQALNINDLKRYSPEARVNLPVLTSKDVVTRMLPATAAMLGSLPR